MPTTAPFTNPETAPDGHQLARGEAPLHGYRYWSGYLTRDNLRAVARLLSDALVGARFTTVEAFQAMGTGRDLPPTVRVGQTLADYGQGLVWINNDRDTIHLSDGTCSLMLAASPQSMDDARNADARDRIRFDYEQVRGHATFRLTWYAPSGDLNHVVLAVEPERVDRDAR